MKILSWNVRGLGKSRTCLAIRKILHLQEPPIFFYCETKMTAQQVYAGCRDFNFEHRFAVDRNGRGGGLTLFWSS